MLRCGHTLRFYELLGFSAPWVTRRAPGGAVALRAAGHSGIPLPLARPAPPRHLLVRGGCEVLHPLRGVVPLPKQVLEPTPTLRAGQRQVVGLRRL